MCGSLISHIIWHHSQPWVGNFIGPYSNTSIAQWSSSHARLTPLLAWIVVLDFLHLWWVPSMFLISIAPQTSLQMATHEFTFPPIFCIDDYTRLPPFMADISLWCLILGHCSAAALPPPHRQVFPKGASNSPGLLTNFARPSEPFASSYLMPVIHLRHNRAGSYGPSMKSGTKI